MRSVQKVSSHALWKRETFIEEDTRYKKHCTQDNDASVPFKVDTLGPHTILPVSISCPVVFSWISLMVWNLFPLKGDFSFGNSQKSQGAKCGLWWGWVTCGVWCFTKTLCRRHDAWAGTLSWWSCQLPVAHSNWVIRIVSTEECSSLMQNLMQICYSTHLVILNVMATQYTCSLNGVYRPHWLVQWHPHCSHMRIPVHSPWLPVTLMAHKPFSC